MSCSSPPVASSRSRAGGSSELLPHLDRQQRDPPRVALGVLVLLREQPDEAAHLRAEERLLGRDDLGAAQVARERARRRGTEEIGRHGQPDEQDARDLEPVAEPPGEVEIALRQRGNQRAGEPDEPDEDAEIGASPRQQHRVQRPSGEHAVEGEPDGEQGEGGETGRLRHGRHELRQPERRHPEGDDADHQRRLEPEQGRHRARAARGRQGGESEDDASHREGGGAGQGDDAVHLDDEAWAREAVDEEQRRHHRERRADEHRAGVPPAPAPIGEGDAGGRREQRREHDGEEVRLAREHHLLPADEVDQGRRKDRNGAAGNQQGHECITPHAPVIGTG